MKKLVIISDTHAMHDQIDVPDGDILIHCGDWTNRGDALEMEKFLDWFSAQPQPNKIFIAGNHELTLDIGVRTRSAALDLIKEYTDKNSNLYYLENTSVVIDGVKFYGSPYTPFFFNWAFNRQRGRDIAIEWEKIPDDINVLITHGAPYGTLDLVENTASNAGRDLHQGCKDLANRIAELKNLRLNCFGHLHYNGGQTKVVNDVIYVNAACCTENYKPTNKPVVIDLECE